MHIEPIKKITLTEQVMKKIADMITTGELKPGDKLPNERDLSAMFEVTRSRVREALRALSLVNMITIKPGDGSFVSELDKKLPEEAVMWMYHEEMNKHDEIYAARQLIETEVYLTCYDHKTPDVLEHIDQYQKALLDVDIDDISTEEFCDLLGNIDTYIGNFCGNSVYSKLMQVIVLIRRSASINILKLRTSKESAVFYRVKILNAFHQPERIKVKKLLNDFYKNSKKEISIH